VLSYSHSFNFCAASLCIAKGIALLEQTVIFTSKPFKIAKLHYLIMHNVFPIYALLFLSNFDFCAAILKVFLNFKRLRDVFVCSKKKIPYGLQRKNRNCLEVVAHKSKIYFA